MDDDNFIDFQNQNKFYFNKFLYFRDNNIEKLHSDYQRLTESCYILAFILVVNIAYEIWHTIKYGKLYPSIITVIPGLIMIFLQLIGGIPFFVLINRYRARRKSRRGNNNNNKNSINK